MKKGSLIWIIILFAVLAVMGLMFFLSPEPSTPEVKLPPVSISSVPEASGEDSPSDSRLEITPANVQAVIATLKEQETYSRSITITRYWSGGENTQNLEIRKKGESCSIVADETKNILITGSSVYIFYPDKASFYEGASAEKDALSYSGLIDFSEVLGLSADLIIDAGYEELYGDTCIFVEYINDGNDYRRRCHVSIAYGMLMDCVEQDETGKTVYSMKSSAPDLSTPSDDYFTIPS